MFNRDKDCYFQQIVLGLLDVKLQKKDKLILYLMSYTKNRSKIKVDLYVRANTIKPPGENFYNLVLGKEFLNMTQNA
jgi:hypothetical protein